MTAKELLDLEREIEYLKQEYLDLESIEDVFKRYYFDESGKYKGYEIKIGRLEFNNNLSENEKSTIVLDSIRFDFKHFKDQLEKLKDKLRKKEEKYQKIIEILEGIDVHD